MQGHGELRDDKLSSGVEVVSECPRVEPGKDSMAYVGFRKYSCNSTKENFSPICVVFQLCVVAGTRPEPGSKNLAKLCTTS